jgi:hypothetical protein
VSSEKKLRYAEGTTNEKYDCKTLKHMKVNDCKIARVQWALKQCLLSTLCILKKGKNEMGSPSKKGK